jgi:hypothetical protein
MPTVKRVKDTEEVVSGARRLMRGLEARARDEDPWVLGEMIAIRNELDEATVRVVKRLREVGYSWPDIAFSLNITADTAIKRYAKRIAS